MTLNLLMDECFGVKTVREVAAFLCKNNKPSTDRPKITMVSLVDYLSTGGIKDENWVPVIAQDQNPWVVVTADRGRAKIGAPLQKILPEFGIPSVYVTRKIPQWSGAWKFQPVLAALPSIVRLANSGEALRLKVTSNTNAQTGVTVKPWPLTT